MTTIERRHGGRVNAIGTVRRLQALQYNGWTDGQLARQLACSTDLVWVMKRQQQVTAETAATVAALYDRLWAASPPAGTACQAAMNLRVRRAAMRRGWCPPLAWDDDNDDGHGIDDPAATPAPGWRRHRRTDLAGIAEDVRWLRRTQGISTRQAAWRLHRSRDTVEAALCRYPDVQQVPEDEVA